MRKEPLQGPRRSARGAFTILELSVSLLIVALVGTGAIWAFFSRGEITLDNAARLLVEDLHLAQDRAALQGTPVGIRFFGDGSGYEIVGHAAGLLRTEQSAGERRHYASDAVFEGVRIVAVDFGTRRSVLFDGRGSTVHAGTITLSYRGEARTVVIDTGRGEIRVPGSPLPD